MARVRRGGILGTASPTFNGSVTSWNNSNVRQTIYTCPADCLRAEVSVETSAYVSDMQLIVELERANGERIIVPALSSNVDLSAFVTPILGYTNAMGVDRGSPYTMMLPIFPGEKLVVSVHYLGPIGAFTQPMQIYGVEYDRTGPEDDVVVPWWRSWYSTTGGPGTPLTWDWKTEIGDWDYMEVVLPYCNLGTGGKFSFGRYARVTKRLAVGDQYTALTNQFSNGYGASSFTLERAAVNDTVILYPLNNEVDISNVFCFAWGSKGKYQ